MRSLTTVLLLAALAWSCSMGTAHARAWTVEKDGSGDFTIVQDALDAAAPGDSILIGPGRFETFRPLTSVVDGFKLAAIAWVTTTDLTIIGAGRDQTVLGPLVPTADFEGLKTGTLYIDGGAVTRIEGFELDNTCLIVTIRERTIMEDCRLTRVPLIDSFALTVGEAVGVEIRRTDFFGPSAILTASGPRDLLVEDCTFDDPSLSGNAVVIGNGAQNCTIRRCNFSGGAEGVQFSFGGTGTVEDCVFEGVRVVGIDVSGGSAIVRRCRIGLTRQGLRVGIGRLEVYDTILEGGTQYTIVTTGDVFVRNSHILNAAEFTVLGSAEDPGEVVDLRYNWWGTADTTQIKAWINDDVGNVLWRPIADAPIPTESSSVGGLKGRFRGSRAVRN